jgi:hypothetical protein
VSVGRRIRLSLDRFLPNSTIYCIFLILCLSQNSNGLSDGIQSGDKANQTYQSLFFNCTLEDDKDGYCYLSNTPAKTFEHLATPEEFKMFLQLMQCMKIGQMAKPYNSLVILENMWSSVERTTLTFEVSPFHCGSRVNLGMMTMLQ